jgi:hypothetical protein
MSGVWVRLLGGMIAVATGAAAVVVVILLVRGVL